MSPNLFGGICLSLAAAIWGSLFVVSKYVLDYVQPMTLLWIRYVIAFVLLSLMLVLHNNRIGRRSVFQRPLRDWLLLALIGFVGYFGSVAMQFFGTKLSDAHTGALIMSATPAFVFIFARFVLHESITLKKVISLVLATTGVVIVIGWAPTDGDYFFGVLILVGATVLWALMSVYVKVASDLFTTLEITTWSILVALVLSTPFMLLELKQCGPDLSVPAVVAGVAYIGIVSTAVAYYLWNKGLELMSAGGGSLYLFLQPIVGSILGWLLLGERLPVSFFTGGLLIALGVVIVTRDERKVPTDARISNHTANHKNR